MPSQSSSGKRCSSRMPLIAEKKPKVTAPTEPTTVVPTRLLQDLQSSVSQAIWKVSQLPTSNLDARGEVMAILGAMESKLDTYEVGKRKKFGTLLGSENLVDIFSCLSRDSLDSLQLVCVRFKAVIAKKMADCCLRNIDIAKLEQAPAVT
ncbi:hypothetical protein AAVH_33673, partial [Aphelenchoides avenae]